MQWTFVTLTIVDIVLGLCLFYIIFSSVDLKVKACTLTWDSYRYFKCRIFYFWLNVEMWLSVHACIQNRSFLIAYSFWGNGAILNCCLDNKWTNHSIIYSSLKVWSHKLDRVCRLWHLEKRLGLGKEGLGLGLASKPKWKVSVSSRSRGKLERSRLGLVLIKLSNVSVSSRSRKKRSRLHPWAKALRFRAVHMRRNLSPWNGPSRLTFISWTSQISHILSCPTFRFFPTPMRLSVRRVRSFVRSDIFYHDISWMPWTILVKLTGNIH